MGTHTPLERPGLASTTPPRVSERSATTSMSELTPLVPTLRPLSPRDQSLSPSRLTRLSSNPTPPVSSLAPLAEPNSITVSSLSDMELSLDKTTSSSRTPGDHPGVIKDTSRSEPTTSAVSSLNHLTQLSELSRICCNSYQINIESRS